MESKPLGGSCIGDKECVLDRACALESGSIKPTLSDTRRSTVMVVVSACERSIFQTSLVFGSTSWRAVFGGTYGYFETRLA